MKQGAHIRGIGHTTGGIIWEERGCVVLGTVSVNSRLGRHFDVGHLECQQRSPMVRLEEGRWQLMTNLLANKGKRLSMEVIGLSECDHVSPHRMDELDLRAGIS